MLLRGVPYATVMSMVRDAALMVAGAIWMPAGEVML